MSDSATSSNNADLTVDRINAILPPYAKHVGITAERIDEGVPVLAFDFSDGVTGRPGYLHGGALSGLLEMAAIAALRAHIAAHGDEGTRIKPVNITVDFMRGGREKRTFAKGEITRIGRRVANVTVRAWQDETAKPIASANMNFLLAPKKTADDA